VAQALQEGEAQACFSNAPPALIVGPCTAKANAKVMLAAALRCYSIFAIVAMAFVSSASSAIGSQPLKNDSAGILPFADHDEVRSFSLPDLCIFCDVPSASAIKRGMHQCEHRQRKRQQTGISLFSCVRPHVTLSR
jgi:hypothetical protein